MMQVLLIIDLSLPYQAFYWMGNLGILIFEPLSVVDLGEGSGGQALLVLG